MGKKHGKAWWFTDDTGRRIGWLWPEDFAAILESWYGDRKWVNAFCEEFDFNRSQVDRYRHGQAPIPKHVALIVNMLSTMRNLHIPMPDVEADWLPEEPADLDRTAGITKASQKKVKQVA